MNQFNASRQPMPAQRPSTAPGSAEARKLAEDLMDAMNALLGLIERETEPRSSRQGPRGDDAREQEAGVSRATMSAPSAS